MPTEVKGGETLDGVLEGPLVHGASSGVSGTAYPIGVNASGSVSTALPDAVVAADDMANPTAPQVLGHNMLYDGSTWDRARGITLGSNTEANAVPTVACSDLADATYVGDIKFGESLPAGTNNIGDVDVLSTVDPHLEIAKGNVSGTTYVHKFGYTPDFDTADSPTIWDGANDGGIDAMQYTYSATADIGILSSDAAGDTQTVEVQGLDTNWDLNTTTYTLNGTTDVDMSATGTDLIRVFRMKITGSTSNAGNIYIRINGSTATAGVPDTGSECRAVIEVGLNQTLMCLYSIPNAKKGYLNQFYAALAGTNKTSDYRIDFYARPFGEVFQIKNRRVLQDGGSSSETHSYRVPVVYAAKTDIEMRVTALTAAVTGAAFAAGFDLTLVDD